MLAKPKGAWLNDHAWSKKPFVAKLSICWAYLAPEWLTKTVVAFVFASLVGLIGALVCAFMMWDWAYMWTWWTRMWWAIWFLVFVLAS